MTTFYQRGEVSTKCWKTVSPKREREKMDLDISSNIKWRKVPEIKTLNRSKDIFKLQDFITSPAFNFQLLLHEMLWRLCSFTWLDIGSWVWAWKYQSQRTEHIVVVFLYSYDVPFGYQWRLMRENKTNKHKSLSPFAKAKRLYNQKKITITTDTHSCNKGFQLWMK